MRRKRPRHRPPPLRISAICLAGPGRQPHVSTGSACSPTSSCARFCATTLRTPGSILATADGVARRRVRGIRAHGQARPLWRAERYASEYETGRARRLGLNPRPLLGARRATGAAARNSTDVLFPSDSQADTAARIQEFLDGSRRTLQAVPPLRLPYPKIPLYN